ncbi:OmpA family protein [Amphiplicatus metriothermophilus]|uniref:Outer membrane protein OmpA n=1 Tax=Amphiplicatus metriothermophilus TaxID=1519374 RepID=A0A239PKY7_9PROT|nr:OmpA family protein [Amphiplicatus metriothermophilus]MBB5517420.1 outer membrane protein OmpA-like peptidoglycan-associated protein [Amphiplicatus metriothermophilus]SNT68245.1 Outer membrane protein OmpA [Amphiplicatus metriothermophilus]
MKLKSVLFAAVSAVAIAPAANAYEGLYGAVGAGLSYMQPDRDVESPGVWDSEADYDNGIGVYTALGYAYGNNWRTELEFSYRSHDVRHFAGDGLGFAGWSGGALSGELQSYAIMANLVRDFDFGSDRVTPYLGVGVGGAVSEANFNGSSPAGTILIDDSSTRLAYQGIAGLAFALAENLSFDVSYRYFGTTENKFDASGTGVGAFIHHENQSHNLFAGLRWNFGAAQPKPVPVQYKDCWDGSSVPVTAECPPQLVERQQAILEPVEFVVYFDYDKSNLTPEAAALVREAAQRALANDIDVVMVEGHTDRSGSSAYNQALSQRRANVVRDALIANGVPANRIQVSALGEDRPAKPTPDGVREPLNRRTEVRISFQ